MGMMINRRRACGGKSLPYDAEIEYLESTGKQYIDSGIVPSRYLETIVDFQFTSLADDQSVFGHWRVGYVVYMITAYSSQYYWGSMTNQYNSFGFDLNRHIAKIDGNGSFVLDGNQDTRKAVDKLCDGSMYIFARHLTNYSPQMTYAFLKLYTFKCTKYGQSILDLIPVRIGSIGYMYDKVSGQLFGNAGTGSFILGPDK